MELFSELPDRSRNVKFWRMRLIENSKPTSPPQVATSVLDIIASVMVRELDFKATTDLGRGRWKRVH